MNSLKKCISISILINFFTLYCGTNKIIQISIPKAGTHLLAKCIRLITGKNEFIGFQKDYQLSHIDFGKVYNLTENQFLLTHIFFEKQYVDLLDNMNYKKIFIYRDPRDQIVSFAFYMHNYPTVWPSAADMPFDELLLDVISEGKTYNGRPPIKGIAQWYAAYLPWLSDPKTLCIKFEDLVGPLGGGQTESQDLTIKQITEYLQLTLSSGQLMNIKNALFGNTGTFREGQIGSWKKHFKQEHIELFKKTAGDLLIELGYEEDLNW